MTKFDLDVANIAESIMGGDPNPVPVGVTPEDEKLMKTPVPQEFVETLVLGNNDHHTIPERLTEAVKQEETPDEKTPKELVSELKDLIAKAKGLIQEMTTCGMLGVGPGPTAKPKKKKKKVAKKKAKKPSVNDLVEQILSGK